MIVIREKWDKWNGLSIEVLKWIAALTMIIDHIGIVWCVNTPMYTVMRIMGRAAFPLYCFMLVEGFFHTQNLKKYIIRLGIFAVLSEIPFDLTVVGKAFYPDYQNAIITLLIGLLTIIGCECYRKEQKWIYASLIGLIGICSADLIQSDYGAGGILLILAFYICRDKKMLRFLLAAIIFIWMGFLNRDFIVCYGIIAMIPIFLYKGEKGKKCMPWQFWYLVYPVHLLIFGIIRII